MYIHEYQAKEYLASYEIPIPPFTVISTLEEVEALDLEEAVLKIQVQAGGRGKAGGVKLARGKKEILEVAKQLLGMKMVGPQTGTEGIIAKKVMITPIVSIEKEYYISIVIDRSQAKALLIASQEGGMEIEEIAKNDPAKILQIEVELFGKIRPFRLVRLCNFMGWKGDIAKQGTHIVEALAKAFMASDASLLEINPLVLSQGKLLVLDAKCNIDDNALFRQKDFALLYDKEQHSKAEADAKEYDLAYVAMEGNIGCMVNGAGLAMATMDLIHQYGGKPANFLDVGGGASKEKIAKGCQIILEDPKVEVLLVNIFGGIMDCALIAEGILLACDHLSSKIPFVVRMEGTNVDKGREILRASKQKIVTVNSLEEAAKEAVSLLKR